MYSYTYIATYVYVTTYVCVTYNYESACRTFMYHTHHAHTYMSKYLLASCIHILLALV